MKRARLYFATRLAGLSLSVLMSAVLSISALASDLKLPVPEQETLPNGLKVVWFVNDHLPIVNLNLLVQSGYRDDPAGKSGTAQLVAEGLARGSAGLSAQQMAAEFEKLGASRYASTDEDSFSVGVHGLAPDADKLIELVGKLALQPDFKPDEIKREHARTLDRWEHIGEYGETLAALAYYRRVAAGSTYGRGSLVSAAEFRKVGLTDVTAFYRRHFTPKNSVLMVVGRVDRARFRARVEAVFGAWRGEAPARQWKPFVDRRLGAYKKGEVLLVDRKGLNQAQVRIGFRAPLIGHPDHYSLVVANALLGEFFNSRLNSVIRDKLGLTYSIGSGFSYSKDFANFTISAATRNEMVGELLTQTVAVIEGLKKGPIEASEVQVSKEYLEGGFPLGTSTLESVASRWLAGYVFNLGPDYLNEFVPRVRAVTEAQVRQAVLKHFDLDHLVIAVAGDAEEIGPLLKKLPVSQGASAPVAMPFNVRRVSVGDLK
jgi:zinc protease